jgi:hypothetical protein
VPADVMGRQRSHTSGRAAGARTVKAREDTDVAADPRRISMLLAGIRIANGLALVFVPSLPERTYLGPGARLPTARALARFTGVRELVLGVGTALALHARAHDAEVVAAGAICDAVDAVISLTSPGLELRTRLAAVTAIAGASAGFWAARRLTHDMRKATPFTSTLPR